MLLFALGITSFPQIMDTSLVLSGNYEAAPELDSNHIGTSPICGNKNNTDGSLVVAPAPDKDTNHQMDVTSTPPN